MPPMGLKELLTQIDQLSREERQQIVNHIQTIDEAQEAAWEEKSLHAVLGDTYRADGTFDFDRLYASGRFVDGSALHEDTPEWVDDEGRINPSNDHDA